MTNNQQIRSIEREIGWYGLPAPNTTTFRWRMHDMSSQGKSWSLYMLRCPSQKNAAANTPAETRPPTYVPIARNSSRQGAKICVESARYFISAAHSPVARPRPLRLLCPPYLASPALRVLNHATKPPACPGPLPCDRPHPQLVHLTQHPTVHGRGALEMHPSPMICVLQCRARRAVLAPLDPHPSPSLDPDLDTLVAVPTSPSLALALALDVGGAEGTEDTHGNSYGGTMVPQLAHTVPSGEQKMKKTKRSPLDRQGTSRGRTILACQSLDEDGSTRTAGALHADVETPYRYWAPHPAASHRGSQWAWALALALAWGQGRRPVGPRLIHSLLCSHRSTLPVD